MHMVGVLLWFGADGVTHIPQGYPTGTMTPVLVEQPRKGRMNRFIPAWISNNIFSKMWDEITYLFLNFNGCTAEV